MDSSDKIGSIGALVSALAFFGRRCNAAADAVGLSYTLIACKMKPPDPDVFISG